jgi:hypothetical protein
MAGAMRIVKPGRSVDWTPEKIAALTTPDVRQLRANAERLNDPEIMARCDTVLVERRRAGAKLKSDARRAAEKKDPMPGGTA